MRWLIGALATLANEPPWRMNGWVIVSTVLQLFVAAGSAIGVVVMLVQAPACSPVTSTDEARAADAAVKTLEWACPSYKPGRSATLDRICPIILREPELPMVESRDGG